MNIRLVCLLLFGLVMAMSRAAEDKAPTPAKIRDFPIETLARLGREIYRHDQMAWVATDTLLAKQPPEKLQRDGARGWVVDTTAANAPFVRFCREKNGQLEAAYDIVMKTGAKPALTEPKDRKLTEVQKAHLSARNAALQALQEQQRPWCGGNPNFVILDDPDGSGYLVYVLRPKPTMEEVPVGGHYRVTVAKDGTTIEQVDQLFASCLTVSKVPPEGQIAALTMSHLVSDTPLETHVFLSLQEKLPFFVVTAGGTMWQVKDGDIASMGTVPEATVKPGTEPRHHGPAPQKSN